LSESIIDQAVVQVRTISGSKVVVAYVVSSRAIDKKSLQDCLRDKLPEYMLPSYYVILDSLPLTSNGKVDHRGLPSVLESDMIKEDYVGPRTDQERVLVGVWEEVLQRSPISVKDSFYNLGGDSIKSIQVVSRLKQQGYSLKVDQLLRHSVLEDLSPFLDKHTREIDQSSVVGNVGLTPIQHYFFNDPSITDLHHFNQSVLLRSNTALSEDLLLLSLDALVSHHDALRMVYTKEGVDWHQFNQPVSKEHYSFAFYDLSEESSALTVMGSLCQELQSSIDLAQGPLLKVGHFRLSDGDRLALIVHHLVVDGVSWRILLEDLSTLYTGYLEADSVVLPLKTDSFQQWSSLQSDYALSSDMILEHSYWDKICSGSYPDLVVDKESSESVIQLTGTEGFVLDKDLTELLQTRVHGVYNTEINDLLLTSLGLALRDVLGLDQSVLKMEGHGREDLYEAIDITRTVGWFTSIYPFVLDVSGSDSSVSSLIQVKESLRNVPTKGIGYGILKYLGSGFSKDLRPGIVFNYLGDFGRNAGGSRDSIFEYCSEYIGEDVADSTGTDTLLSVSGMLVLDELNISIGYSESHYNVSTIEELCCSYQNHLRYLIESLSSEERNYITPSDLTFKGLQVDELSSINKDFNVEDIYPLSPLQEGMYFHWLSDNSTSLYFEQLSYRLRSESLDISSVKEAYKSLILRHPVLRTSFTNDYGGVPLQVVRNDVEGSFSYDQIPEGEDVLSYVEKVKLLDRDCGFDLEGSSQMRLKVLDLGSGLYEFIWSFHHILMDGWCISILVNDFYELLDSSQNTRVSVLPEITPYSNYIDWLSGVDKQASLSYWRDYLSGYSTLSEVPFKLDSGIEDQGYRLGLETITISGDLYSSLEGLCQDIGITQNIFIQGVWGYLLSRYNDIQDVVFGSVVSGRPGDLSGVEDM
ncbi:condensation domain-containing protein, partial [Aquimarina sp. M1]